MVDKNKLYPKEISEAKRYCLRLLALRARAEKELDSRLKAKGIGPSARKEALEFLKGKGVVNDLEFAREWIDSRLRTSPRSAEALREELRKKGIEDSLIDSAILEKADDLDEKALMLRMAKEKIGKEKDIPKKNIKAKVFRYLVSKGFDSFAAEEAVNGLIGDDEAEGL